MYEDAKMTPEESLQLIAEHISKTRDNIREYSYLFLLWGWLLTIACACRYLLQGMPGSFYYYVPFPLLSFVGIVITLLYYYRKSRLAETYLSFFLRKMWMILIIGFLTVVFVCINQRIQPSSFVLILEGAGALVSGLVLKFRPLEAGGILFFIGAVCTVYIRDEYKDLVHGFCIVSGYLIPGYLLRNLKTQNQAHGI